MANYTSVQDLVSGISNATQLITNTDYDDNVYTDTISSPFSFFGLSISNFYISGNSFIGYNGNSESYAFLVNRRDAKMRNLYREEGKVLGTKFVRYRWNGYPHYSASSYILTYDVVFTEANVIYLHLVEVSSSYWNGYTCFTYNGSQYGRINSADGVIGKSKFNYTFYPTTADTPTSVVSKEGIDNSLLIPDAAYLIKNPDNSKIYTYDHGEFVEITETLTMDVITSRGMTEFPTNLPNKFQVLKWSKNEIGNSIEVVGYPFVTDNEIIFHITGLSVSDVYVSTSVDTDGTVYFSQDGNSYVSADTISDHSDFYVKVIMGTYINSISVLGC